MCGTVGANERDRERRYNRPIGTRRKCLGQVAYEMHGGERDGACERKMGMKRENVGLGVHMRGESL